MEAVSVGQSFHFCYISKKSYIFAGSKATDR